MIAAAFLELLLAFGTPDKGSLSYAAALDTIQQADHALERSTFARCTSEVLQDGVWSIDGVLETTGLPNNVSSDARLTRRFLLAMLRVQAEYHLLAGKLALRDASVGAAYVYFAAARDTDPFDAEIFAYARATGILAATRLNGRDDWQFSKLEERVRDARTRWFARRFQLAPYPQIEARCPDDTP